LYERHLKDLGEGGENLQSTVDSLEKRRLADVDQVDSTPTPGCFMDVYQNKGDTGSGMRKYMKVKEL